MFKRANLDQLAEDGCANREAYRLFVCRPDLAVLSLIHLLAEQLSRPNSPLLSPRLANRLALLHRRISLHSAESLTLGSHSLSDSVSQVGARRGGAAEVRGGEDGKSEVGQR